MKVIYVDSLKELERVFPLLNELRDHLSFDEFISLYNQAKQLTNYKMSAFENESGELVALMGHRILVDFVHGRHFYIDDLVVSKKYRSQGIGAKVLKIAEELAAENSCNNLRLCTGIQNDQGKKFYENNGWSLRAVAYKKKL